MILFYNRNNISHYSFLKVTTLIGSAQHKLNISPRLKTPQSSKSQFSRPNLSIRSPSSSSLHPALRRSTADHKTLFLANVSKPAFITTLVQNTIIQAWLIVKPPIHGSLSRVDYCCGNQEAKTEDVIANIASSRGNKYPWCHQGDIYCDIVQYDYTWTPNRDNTKQSANYKTVP